jgi:hypothetical protein
MRGTQRTAVAFAIFGAASGLAVLVSCVGDDSSPTKDRSGEEGQPCFSNGTCNAGLTCLSNTCVNTGGGDAASSTDATTAQDAGTTVDGSMSSNDDGSTTLPAEGGFDAGPSCGQVDAAFCEDFETHALGTIGDPVISNGATLAISTTNPINGARSLVASLPNPQPSDGTQLIHDFANSLGAFSSITLDANFRCTAPDAAVLGVPLGFYFWSDAPADMNGSQVLAALYPSSLMINEGVWMDGGLSATGKMAEVTNFNCGTTPHHVTLSIVAAAGFQATLTVDGVPKTVALSASFTFGSGVTMFVGIQNSYYATPEIVVLDDVIVRTK